MIKTDAMYAELVHKIDQATESGQIDAIKNRLDAIEADIPADASSSNKFSTASDITGITEKIPDTASSSNQLATASDITGITELIPSDASTSNKLATVSDIVAMKKLTLFAFDTNTSVSRADLSGVFNQIVALNLNIACLVWKTSTAGRITEAIYYLHSKKDTDRYVFASPTSEYWSHISIITIGIDDSRSGQGVASSYASSIAISALDGTRELTLYYL